METLDITIHTKNNSYIHKYTQYKSTFNKNDLISICEDDDIDVSDITKIDINNSINTTFYIYNQNTNLSNIHVTLNNSNGVFYLDKVVNKLSIINSKKREGPTDIIKLFFITISKNAEIFGETKNYNIHLNGLGVE